MGRRQPKAYDAVILDRRRAVASLRLRGMSIREIERALTEMRNLNPETGNPWCIQTIHADWKALEKDWKAEASASVDQLRAKINAELDEVKRFGWRKDDPVAILRAIEQQRRLLGIDLAAGAGDTPPVQNNITVLGASYATLDEIKQTLEENANSGKV